MRNLGFDNDKELKWTEVGFLITIFTHRGSCSGESFLVVLFVWNQEMEKDRDNFI